MKTQLLQFTFNEAHLLEINNNLLEENATRTRNEQQLYAAWQVSEMDKKQMQTTIHNLNEQLKVMKLEIEKLKLNQNQSEITSQEEINYDGDHADDAKWVRVQNGKKEGCWAM
jgi:hypothetical protein